MLLTDEYGEIDRDTFSMIYFFKHMNSNLNTRVSNVIAKCPINVGVEGRGGRRGGAHIQSVMDFNSETARRAVKN